MSHAQAAGAAALAKTSVGGSGTGTPVDLFLGDTR
jgi:hypothetical protein